MPRDSIFGVGVLVSIAFVVAVVILKKGKDEVPVPFSPDIQEIRVVDGDTIEVNSKKIRLFGIDAPEMGQPRKRNNAPYNCGAASKGHLDFILTDTNVECDDKGKDKWGRFISVCKAEGEDISRLMVRHGWALAYRKFSAAYVSDEEFARSNKLGMWAKEFSTPSEWRKSKKGDTL